MAVQVSYPGVYVDEFAPGAPIEGVGTNTAAFLGLAQRGPRSAPTLIQSWDAFTATFGGFLTDPKAWLAQGVYGFFLNGGTACYVVRVSSAESAATALPARKSGNTVDVGALAEGPEGNGISVTVSDSSRSDDAAAAAMTRVIRSVSTDRTTLAVSSLTDLVAGDHLTLQPADVTAASQDVVIASIAAPATILLTAAATGTDELRGGTAAKAFTVRIAFHEATVGTVPGPTSVTLTDAAHGFAQGDSVLLRKADASSIATATVTAVSGTTISFTPALSTPSDAAGGSVRTADVVAGTTRFRLDTPTGLGVATAFPPGSLLAVTPDAGTPVYLTIVAAGGDTVQVAAPGLPAPPAPVTLTDQASAPTVATADFDLNVTPVGGGPAEPTLRYLGSEPTGSRYWGAVASDLVVLTAPEIPGASADNGDSRPKAGTYVTGGGVADEPATSWTALATDPVEYLTPLTRLHDVSLVAIPGATEQNITSALITHCETLQDRFAILDSDAGADLTQVRDQFAQVRSAKGYAALYFPRITVVDPGDGSVRAWPPSGHLAGVYARTDSQRGVFKAPANTPVAGAVGLERLLSNAEQGPINLMGINALRTFPGQSQPQVWGARTTAGDLDRNWQYVNVRRLFIYLEQSIEAGIRWAVFEPNDLSLWQKLKRSITNFLVQAWTDGALFGAKPEDAFYVRIDEVLNPPSTRALGRLYIEVGVVPTYPAEFIVLRIGIWDGGSEVSVT